MTEITALYSTLYTSYPMSLCVVRFFLVNIIKNVCPAPLNWGRKWQATPVFLPGESQGRGAWWAAVYGVAQSRTRLSDLAAAAAAPLDSFY